MLDHSKVLFIICVNNELYRDECLRCIQNLNIPQGITVETVCIEKADSIVQAYNEAMHSSNAKYKVYLHQDVFIYNPDFIDDILGIFRSEEKIGMLGVIGGVDLPKDGVIWNSWNLGRTIGCTYEHCVLVKGFQDETKTWIPAEALDGMLLATQYDLEWREDLGFHWDGYDISQSLEFRRKGYQLAIPYQKTPWCLHDCGPSSVGDYDAARKILLKEYSEYFGGEYVETANHEVATLQKKLVSALWDYICAGQIQEAATIIQSCETKALANKNLRYIVNLTEIILREKETYGDIIFLTSDIHTLEDAKDKYDTVKFLLRRIELAGDETAYQTVNEVLRNRALTRESIEVIARHSLVNPERMFELFSSSFCD